MALVNPVVAGSATSPAGTAAAAGTSLVPIVISPAALSTPGGKDSRWLTLEVCREFARSKCSRSDEECKYAHPPPHVEIQNGRVMCCFDSIKGKCQRRDPPCKYLHPPQHLKEILLQNGRQNLIYKNLQNQMQTAATLQQYAGMPAMIPTIVYDGGSMKQQQQQLIQSASPAFHSGPASFANMVLPGPSSAPTHSLHGQYITMLPQSAGTAQYILPPSSYQYQCYSGAPSIMTPAGYYQPQSLDMAGSSLVSPSLALSPATALAQSNAAAAGWSLAGLPTAGCYTLPSAGSLQAFADRKSVV